MKTDFMLYISLFPRDCARECISKFSTKHFEEPDFVYKLIGMPFCFKEHSMINSLPKGSRIPILAKNCIYPRSTIIFHFSLFKSMSLQ